MARSKSLGVDDEESIGAEGRSGIRWRVQVDGDRERYERSGAVPARPGYSIRFSLGPAQGRRDGIRKVVRAIAYVDPITGKLVIRMGQWDVSKGTKGEEESQQVVFESDVPICKIDK